MTPTDYIMTDWCLLYCVIVAAIFVVGFAAGYTMQYNRVMRILKRMRDEAQKKLDEQGPE